MSPVSVRSMERNALPFLASINKSLPRIIYSCSVFQENRSIINISGVIPKQPATATRRFISCYTDIQFKRIINVSERATFQQNYLADPKQQQRRSMVVVLQHKAVSTPTSSSTTSATTASTPSPSDVDPVVTNTPAPTVPVNNVNFPSTKEDDRDNFLIITDSCWKQIERLAAKKGYATDQVYLRVFVDAGGCSGFTYQFEFHNTTDDDIIDEEKEDLVWIHPTSGSRVVVDVGSMDFLRGATLDYVVEMIKSSFEVRENPQSESACGCGSSFALKKFTANPAID